MKKSIVFLCIAGILFYSCTKEVDYKSTSQQNEVIDAQRALVITSTLTDVKTTYDGETTFKWIEGDKIGVYMTLGETSGVYEFTAEETGSSVKFTHVLTDAEQTALGEGKPVYGTHAYYPYNSGDVSITVGGTDANPTVTLAGTITQPTTNPMSVIPMVGKNDGFGTYSFVAITGILKLTISDMPENAQKVHLLANGQAFNAQYSLLEDTNGMYVDLTNFSSGYVDKQIVFTPTSDGDDHDDPVSTGDTRVFYFPIPEGTIASGMTVKLKDGSNNVLMSRTTNTSITINRNKITPLATFTTWKSLGTGKFIDSRTFTESGNTAEYVNVEVQQSRIYPNRFRLVNPYGTAWTHFSYTWSESWSPTGPSDYLSFYVMDWGDSYPYGNKTATADGRVYFYPHFTGSASMTTHIIGSETIKGEIRLTHSNFHNNAYLADSQVYNYQASGLPANVSLHPKYVYRKNDSGNENVEDTNILIAFPGCSPQEYADYSASITAVGGTSNAITATLDIGADASKAKVVLANDQSAGVALIDAGNDAVQTLTADGTTGALSGANITRSGLCYIVVCTYDSGNNKKLTRSIPVYYLTNPDKIKFCKQHADGHDTYWDNAASTNMTITFAVSDNPLTSNIMITEFDGMSYNAAPVANAKFYARASVAEGQSFASGTPMRGIYNPALGFNAMNCEFTVPYNAQPFFTYNGQSYTLQMNGNTSGYMKFRLNRNYDATGEKYYIRVENNEIKLRWISPTTQSSTYSNAGFRAYAWTTWQED